MTRSIRDAAFAAVLVSSCLVPAGLSAQSAEGKPSPARKVPVYSGGLTCVVPVSDLARAIDWYSDRLGFRVDWQDDRMGFAELFAPVADVRVGLARMPDAAGAKGVTLTYGVYDIEAAARILAEGGTKTGPIEEIPELVKLMQFQDPDGNPLQLYQSLSPAPDSQAGLEAVAFLAGSWIHVDGASRLEEHWTAPLGGLAIGMSRGIQDGRAVFREALRIELTKNGGVAYVASPAGQAETRFLMDARQCGPQRVVFVNAEHDFPKRIAYWLADDGSLRARIDDGEDGGKGRDFRWERGGLR